MQNLQIDEEFQSLIPPLTPDELAQLESNLIADGCRDPLVLWDGIIVDGHNRYRICTEHHILFKTVDKQFSSRDDVVEWIIRNQFGRRNLSPGTRSILALRLEPIVAAKARERMISALKQNSPATHNYAEREKGETREIIAKAAGVSRGTIERVKKIVEHGTPDQIERIRRGDKGNTINSVYSEIHPPKPKDASVSDEPPAPEPAPIPPARTLEETIRAMKEPSGEFELTPELLLDEFSSVVSSFIQRLDEFTTNEYAPVYPRFTAKDKDKLQYLMSAMKSKIDTVYNFQKGRFQ